MNRGTTAADQTIGETSKAYEAWLGTQTPLNEADLRAKYDALAEGPFPFLRGTFYRWAQRWPALCPELTTAPRVLAVGDLHVENFGTWRDAEGRLAWGVNDFDEAYELPYTNDLVRLATSALLAIEADHVGVERKDACAAILAGYARGHAAGGRPYVIDEENRWFLEVIAAKTADPAKFWQKIRQVFDERGNGAGAAVPPPAAAALAATLPAGATEVRLSPRRAGVGSLGRPRFVVMAHWLGGPILREIKALTASAVAWATARHGAESLITQLVERTVGAGVRCPDPFFHVGEGWIRRRLAPDAHKIELKAGAKTGYGQELLEAMGWEAANVHLGTAGTSGAILADLKARGDKWLHAAAKVMRDVTIDEQEQWARARHDVGKS